MNYITILPIDYDDLNLPIDTPVTRLENWRPHEACEFVAKFRLPDGSIHVLFYDEVELQNQRSE